MKLIFIMLTENQLRHMFAAFKLILHVGVITVHKKFSSFALSKMAKIFIMARIAGLDIFAIV